MDATQAQFQAQKSFLEKLERFLRQGIELGVHIDPMLSKKLQTAMEHSDKLKVALIGGFSEGKTSIAAAWMERLDKSTMHISQQESSNEVKVYEAGPVMLIDTPGLFGFKEQYNFDTHAIEKYKDTTRKYVSEAHLVLYVMNAVNPIKESHKEELNWLFRTLDLLPRTIFVLSRFDEVADVEDEKEYQHNLSIKSDNVRGRLREAIKASEQEVTEMTVVAVAANPFDRGTEYWLEHLEEFKMLSHIASLQQATKNKIETSGGLIPIVQQMRSSVISDVLHKELPVAVERDREAGENLVRLKGVEQTHAQELQVVQARIIRARADLREFVGEYLSGLIMRTKGLTLETCGAFFEKEIGKNGININIRLKSEFERQCSAASHELGRIQLSFESEIGHYNKAVTNLGKQGVNFLLTGNVINNSSILATRDFISGMAGSLGINLGDALKFQPWGAVKLANSLNTFIAILPAAIEIWDSFKQAEKEKELELFKIEVVKNLEEQREDVIALLDRDTFSENFFPDYVRLQNVLEEVIQRLQRSEETRQQFQEWYNSGKMIEAEFHRYLS